jgi:hypothetical protein
MQKWKYVILQQQTFNSINFFCLAFYNSKLANVSDPAKILSYEAKFKIKKKLSRDANDEKQML